MRQWRKCGPRRLRFSRHRRPPTRRRAELLRIGTQVMTQMSTVPVMTAPWNAGSVGPKRKFQHAQYPFADFREIRRVFGGTLNDVVLTVVTESAARYLKAHNEDTANQNLRLMCPVNVRREDEKGALGNRVSAMYPVVPAATMDVVERLNLIRRVTEQIKANREPQALEYMMETAPVVPPMSMAQTLLVGTPFDPTAWIARQPPPILPDVKPRPPLFGFNFTCTNVPGVQVPQYIAGHKMLTTFATLMLGGTLGYGVAVISYNQTLIFNLVSDPRLLPDLELMRSGIEATFAELLDRAHTQLAKQKEAS